MLAAMDENTFRFIQRLYAPELCDLCGTKIDYFNVVPGELIGFRHAACIDKERARTKHLCRRPYQLPKRKS